ncbi:MAG: hypothetical protein IKT28_01390 [Rikenellaceae bacterium]|nr:hypothetical protein [Rikenellaceae bacterium]
MDEFIVQLIITVVIFLFGLMKRASNKKSKVEIRKEDLVQEITEKRLGSRGDVSNVITPPENVFTCVNNNLDTDVKLDTTKSLVNEPFNGVEEEITLSNNELLEDFDPKKALIYSEILKPKYEEF